ncbi:MAG: hypothetical protein JWO09_2982 [Bacteroidetes bacterium]|nr:hypothetical protein [Bacteroidota bacterium]
MKSHLRVPAVAVLLLLLVSSSFAQEIVTKKTKRAKGTFYGSWGYNRDWFSKSDIHFRNNSGEYNPVTGNYDYYDFTIYNAKATDRDGFKAMLHTDLTIPQYVYRLGYYFNNKKDLGIEINFDHAKYIMSDWQTLHVKGYISDQYIDKDTMISPETFMHFEHSDGANFMMLNIMKRQRLLTSKNNKHWLSAVVKFGFGPVIPRTQVTLFGQDLNNRFHIAGYVTGMEAGLRYDAFKHIYLEYTAKGVFADYRNVLVLGSGKAHHHFWAFENILTLGFQFPL